MRPPFGYCIGSRYILLRLPRSMRTHLRGRPAAAAPRRKTYELPACCLRSVKLLDLRGVWQNFPVVSRSFTAQNARKLVAVVLTLGGGLNR